MTPDLTDVDIVGPSVMESVKLAGAPGTGKTTACAGRVGQLVEDHDVDLADIVWVTYRRALAKETLERLCAWDIIDGWELDDPQTGRTRWIGTAHAIANRIARDNLQGAPVSETDRWDFFDSEYNVRYDPSNGPTRGATAMGVINWLIKNEVGLETPYRAPLYAELQRVWPSHPPLSRIAARWEDYKQEEGLYDFHEMLQAALDTDDYPGSGSSPVVVVADEYHDVYPLMDRVLRRWLHSADIAIAAGDPRQVVNAHEGSSPRYFERLDLPTVTLPRSYRVPKAHWHAATAVLGQHHDVPDITVQDGGRLDRQRSPQFGYDTRTDEWDLPSSRYSPQHCVRACEGSMLFLARTRKQATGIGRALQDSGILYTSQPGAGGWNNTTKRVHLYNALQRVSGITTEPAGWQRYDVQGEATLRGPEAFRLLRHTPVSYSELSGKELRKEAYDLKRERVVEAESLSRVLTQDWWAVFSDTRSACANLTDVTARERQILAQALEANDKPVKETRSIDTSVLTLHGSKGHEARNVVVYDGITTKVQESMRADERLTRNEYRAWYVALTRASDALLILDDAFPWCRPFIPYSVGRSGGAAQC